MIACLRLNAARSRASGDPSNGALRQVPVETGVFIDLAGRRPVQRHSMRLPEHRSEEMRRRPFAHVRYAFRARQRVEKMTLGLAETGRMSQDVGRFAGYRVLSVIPAMPDFVANELEATAGDD